MSGGYFTEDQCESESYNQVNPVNVTEFLWYTVYGFIAIFSNKMYYSLISSKIEMIQISMSFLKLILVNCFL